SNNFYNIGGVGAASSASNTAITVGNAGARFNTLTITNAPLPTISTETIGASSSSNTASILAGGTWIATAPLAEFYVGNGTATGNVLTINNGTLNSQGANGNQSDVYVGSGSGAVGNSLTISKQRPGVRQWLGHRHQRRRQ